MSPALVVLALPSLASADVTLPWQTGQAALGNDAVIEPAIDDTTGTQVFLLTPNGSPTFHGGAFVHTDDVSRLGEPSTDAAGHWDSAYTGHGVEGVSWYQAEPTMSLALIDALPIERDAAVLDVGGGASSLAGRLLGRGFSDVTVLDLSAAALGENRRRVGPDSRVSFVQDDVRSWRPRRRFDLWHDRALVHFFVASDEREAYLRTLVAAVEPGGFAILAVFAPDGPTVCSGLPVSRYSAEDLTLALGDRFQPLETRREEHVTPSGVVQPFTWLAGRFRPG